MAKAKKMETTATANAEQPRRPISLDEMLQRLHRRLSNKYRRWRFCDRPLCRRQRSCMGDARTCSSDGRPKPVASAEERARVMAELQRKLKERLQQHRDTERAR